jgi:hypothetical protein
MFPRDAIEPMNLDPPGEGKKPPGRFIFLPGRIFIDGQAQS